MNPPDIVVIGAGAAGLFCAGIAGQRGARVVVIDHAERLAEKIRISGGGRCNFTNLEADRPERFLADDPRFVRAALRAYPPRRFIELLQRDRIGWHEKHRGQLFCDERSEAVIALLQRECEAGRVDVRHPVRLAGLPRLDADGRFSVDTDAGTLTADRLVIATGGLSIPKIGATDLGLRIARHFGLRVNEPRPGLVPLTFDAAAWQPFVPLAGVATEVGIGLADRADGPRFVEDLLFTHRGLSGPAVLQVSSFWQPGDALSIDLGGAADLQRALRDARERSRQPLSSWLAERLPRRLADIWLARSAHAPLAPRRLAELGNRALDALAADLRDWRITPTGTEGWRKAEVTVGGVAIDELQAGTLAAHRVPGLHFIGEVVDVTGWLGGYNFQWAWASAYGAAQAMTAGR